MSKQVELMQTMIDKKIIIARKKSEIAQRSLEVIENDEFWMCSTILDMFLPRQSGRFEVGSGSYIKEPIESIVCDFFDWCIYTKSRKEEKDFRMQMISVNSFLWIFGFDDMIDKTLSYESLIKVMDFFNIKDGEYYADDIFGR